MWQLKVSVLHLVFRSALIYFALLIGLRVFGKREVGQFKLFDLALVLLVANVVQPAITGPDSSITGGLVIMATLFLINRGVAYLTIRSPQVRELLEGEPTVVARSGNWRRKALAREGLTVQDCLPALREHGLDEVEEVALAMLEVDGTLTVVPRQGDVRQGGRNVRAQKREAQLH